MNCIDVNIENAIAVIHLNNGKSNAIGMEMITELTKAINMVQADDHLSGMILTGKENFFSAGLDLIELYNLDEPQTEHFWQQFLQLQLLLAQFKKPCIAAISGHSPAGGCVLALCCDYRLMVTGDYLIGLNEIPVGIVVPEYIFELYAFWIGKKMAYQFLLEGKLIKSAEALNLGLVDELCKADELLRKAKQKLAVYLKMNPQTWSQSKINMRKDLINKMKTEPEQVLNSVLQQWWLPETRLNLQQIIQKLKPVKPISI